MTSREILLIKASWRFLRNIDPEFVGDVFYTKLFFDAPYLKRLFSENQKEQSKKLVLMLNMIIARLEKLDELRQDIVRLAIQHKRYGVKDVHYDLVGNALLWTLKTALGRDWNSETEQAWNRCYVMLASTMIEAGNASYAGHSR